MYILILPEWGLFTKSGLNCRIKGYMRCFSDLILLVFKDVQPEPNNIHRADGTGIIGRRLLAIKFLRILKTWTDYCEDRAKSFLRLSFCFPSPNRTILLTENSQKFKI